MKCPTCGGHMSDDDVRILRQVGLSPQQKTILTLMLDAYPTQIRTGAFVSNLYANDINGGPDDAEGNVRVQIGNVNKTITHYGWRIVNIHRRYKLVREDSEELKQLNKNDGRVCPKAWSESDIGLLARLYYQGLHPREMTPVLNRNINSIISKIRGMKIDGEIV